jgi:hypothetical protein
MSVVERCSWIGEEFAWRARFLGKVDEAYVENVGRYLQWSRGVGKESYRRDFVSGVYEEEEGRDFLDLFPVSDLESVVDFLGENDSFAELFDYESCFLRTFVDVSRGPIYDTMFLLRTLKICEENDLGWYDGNSASKVYEVTLRTLAEGIMSRSNLEEVYDAVNSGVRTGHCCLARRLDGDIAEVTVAAGQDRYLLQVMDDLKRNLESKFVFKGPKIPLKWSEFGLWYDQDSTSRLKRNHEVTIFLRALLGDDVFQFPREVSYREVGGRARGMVMTELEGDVLMNFTDLDFLSRVISRLPFLHRRAYEHRDNLPRGVVETLNLKREHEGILANLGYDSWDLFEWALPMIEWLEREITDNDFWSFCHGSLHPKQVMVGGDSYGLLDLELAMIAPFHDDLIRLQEGPLFVPSDKKDKNHQIYFSVWNSSQVWDSDLRTAVATSASFNGFKGHVFDISRAIYHLRHYMLGLWGIGHLEFDKQKPERAKKVVGSLESALDSSLEIVVDLPNMFRPSRKAIQGIRRVRANLRSELKCTNLTCLN